MVPGPACHMIESAGRGAKLTSHTISRADKDFVVTSVRCVLMQGGNFNRLRDVLNDAVTQQAVILAICGQWECQFECIMCLTLSNAITDCESMPQPFIAFSKVRYVRHGCVAQL